MKTAGNGDQTHPRQRRSKRLLLLTVVLIIAGQLGVGILLDLDPTKVRFRMAEDIVRTLGNPSDRPSILFLGSSRFAAALNVGVIYKSMHDTFGKETPLMLNGSFPGADPYSMDFFLRHLVRRGLMPTVVVMEISPETVMLGGPFLGGQVTRIMTWRDVPGAVSDLIAFGKLHELISSRFVPIYKFRKEILTYLFGHAPPYLALSTSQQKQLERDAAKEADAPPPLKVEASTNAKQEGRETAEVSPKPPAPVATTGTGVDPPEAHAQNNSDAEREAALQRIHSARPRIQKWLRNYRIRGLNARHLETMLSIFQAKGIPTVLVGVPVSTTHFECYTDDINRKFLTYMDQLCRSYGCRFVDYRNRFPDDLFYDHHHMNLAGGGEFSRVLQEEVLRHAWELKSKAYQHAGHPYPPNS